ncbi:MAG: nucleotidyltransferase family protein [Pirellulales bacterium]|nr:nucleotidyltransferase family protein [Pirellulales bacterium]
MDITAIVLAGGMGTRLRSVVVDRPKVLAPVAGKPFIAYLFAQLEEMGVRHAILSTGYLAETFVDVLGERQGSLQLQYVQEDSPLGTGGAVRWVGQHVRTSHAIVLNGDSYVNADLREYVSWHEQLENDVSLMLVPVADASRYGTVEIDAESRVTAFLEKRPERVAGRINAGIYLLRSELFDQIPDGKCSLEADVLPKWLKSYRVKGFTSAGEFIDIGIPEDYHRSHQFMERFKRV